MNFKKDLGNTILAPLKTYRDSKRTYSKHRHSESYDSYLRSKWKDMPPLMSDNIKIVHNRTQLLQTMLKNAVVAEIGVYKGQFSRRILDVTSPKEFHVIDPWDLLKGHSKHGKQHHKVVLETLQKEIDAGIVTVHKDFSENVLPTFSNNYFDWVYVDADHSYESVIQELNTCKNLVKDNGYICGHDYTRWAGNGLVRFGVVEAVNEFCNEHQYEIVLLTNEPHRHLSYVLKKRK